MGRLIEDTALMDAIRAALRADQDDMSAMLCDGIETVVLKYVPTVDAVPVQRCDGCRYADWHSNGCIAYCTKHGTDGHVADGFCSEGEKDGEQHDTK